MRLVDWQIASLQKRHHVIDPYETVLVRELPRGAALPFGQARDGYVLRLSATSALASYRITIDPKELPKPSDVNGLNFIPPQACLMALTMENVVVPRGYTGRLELVQEYAMCGLSLVVAELYGGVQEGRVLVTLVNPMAVPVLLHHGEGVVKLVLSDEAPLPARGEEDRPAQHRGGAGLTLPASGGDGAGA